MPASARLADNRVHEFSAAAAQRGDGQLTLQFTKAVRAGCNGLANLLVGDRVANTDVHGLSGVLKLSVIPTQMIMIVNSVT